MNPSVSLSRLAPHQVKPLTMSAKEVADFKALERIGIGFEPGYLRSAASAAMDAMDATWAASPAAVTSPSIVAPIQFLQNWLPGFVKVLTAARKIDELVGIETIGNWRDEWIIQGVVEPMGNIAVYKDSTNVPLADWNPNWVQRTIVRFESGVLVGRLEQARAAAAMINSDAEKRAASVLNLEIFRNLVGFYGFNNGSNNTYGFLNDPNLPAYQTVATGVGGFTWAVKTFLEITQDIITAMNTLQVQSQDNIDPETTNTTLAIPFNVAQQLSKLNSLGTLSVRMWLKDTYPKCRVVTAPQLASANGGANVFYLYADTVEDGGTDDKRTFAQVVPVKFMALGVEQRAKSYIEDFTNATAGLMLKRPYACTRWSGI
ncbi:MAG: major capsid family protein [Steroidobacteraceae bacterium]